MSSVSKVFVHIGPLKTGTTYLQAVLYRNRDALAAHGVLLPRETFGLHVRSVLGLMGRRMNPDARTQDSKQWRLLLDEVEAADAHSAVISMEFLCTAPTQVARRLVETLAPAEVHVVYTARDMVKVIPAAWQTLLRNKQAPEWQSWLLSVRENASEGAPRTSVAAAARELLGRDHDYVGDSWGSRLWRQQDPRQVLAPYLEHIPPDRVHVVTVPPSGAPPGLLWERFCAATGLDPHAYDTNVARANESLGGVECEVLRRANLGVAGRIPGDVYSDLMKFFLAREVLEQRTQSFPLVLPESERSWVAERAADAISYFAGGGFQLHGDLADLMSPPSSGPTPSPDDVRDTELLAVMQETLCAVLLEMARRQGLMPYEGPRSHVRPLPPPEELGLTGEPPGPGARLEARVRRALRTAPPPAIVARKAAKKAARQQALREGGLTPKQAAAMGKGPAKKAARKARRRAAKKAQRPPA